MDLRFRLVDQRFDLVDARFSSLLDILEARFVGVESRIDTKFAAFETKLAGVDTKIDSLRSELRANLAESQRHMIQWMVGTLSSVDLAERTYSTTSFFGVRSACTRPAIEARSSTSATKNATVAAWSALRPNSLNP